MTDTGMWTLVWAKDAQGEVGKVPPPPAGCVEINLMKPNLLEDWPVFMSAGKGRRK